MGRLRPCSVSMAGVDTLNTNGPSFAEVLLCAHETAKQQSDLYVLDGQCHCFVIFYKNLVQVANTRD